MFEHLILFHGIELLRDPARLAALGRQASTAAPELARDTAAAVARAALEKFYG